MRRGSAEYVRSRYGVPAKRGGFVRFTGDPAGEKYAKIVGFNNGRLRVRFEDEKHISTLHPTWEVEYLPAEPPMYGPWSAGRLPPDVIKVLPLQGGDNGLAYSYRQRAADVLNAYDRYRERHLADWYDTHDSITGELLDRRR